MKLFAALISISTLSIAAPRYRTIWAFKAAYESGESFESSDTTTEEQVIPWIGSVWNCKKDPVRYGSGKKLIAGFSCYSSSGGFMSVVAGCPATKSSSDANVASVGDSKGYLMFSVVCVTSEVSKSSDTSL